MGTIKNLLKEIKNETSSVRSKTNDSYFDLLELFPLKQIKSVKEYKAALSVAEKIIIFLSTAKKPDKGIKTYLESLAVLISDYEASKFKSSKIKGKDMLAYFIELNELSQADFSKELGSHAVVSKILKGEKELNLKQIKALAKRFKVSPDLFFG